MVIDFWIQATEQLVLLALISVETPNSISNSDYHPRGKNGAT